MHWTEWSQWSLDGSTKLLTVSYYICLASMPLGWLVAGVTRESMIVAGRDNEAASEEVTVTAQCLV